MQYILVCPNCACTDLIQIDNYGTRLRCNRCQHVNNLIAFDFKEAGE